jgi:hypothetical protein
VGLFKILNKSERSLRGMFYDIAGDVLPEGFLIYGLDE